MKLILAPLRGITGSLFREIYCKHFDGISEALAPFIAPGNDSKLGRSLLRDILPENNNAPIPIEPQILGNNPDILDRFIPLIKQEGFNRLNWNIGCPAPMVTKKKRGSGALPYPQIISAYLEKLNSFTDIKYSVKTRLGLNSKSEIKELIPLFERYNCSELTIHPRTGAQMYRGDADIEAFGDIYREISIPLIYNGDIFSKSHGERIMNRFPDVKKILLGRGVLVNPFLPSEILGFDQPSDKQERLHSFLSELTYSYREVLHGDHQTLGKMKEIWGYLYYSFPEAPRMIKKIIKSNSLEQYLERVDELFKRERFVAPGDNFSGETIGGEE